MYLGRDVMVENVHSTESDSWEFLGNVHPTWIQSRRVYCEHEELRICPTQSRICFCEIVMC